MSSNEVTKIVHLQREPIDTPGEECSAACGAAIDDPPSQLAVVSDASDLDFITCAACLAPECWRALIDQMAAELRQARHVMEVDEVIVERMDAEIDHLRAENNELRRTLALNASEREIIEFMSDHYTPYGGRPCALCVYEDGVFVRSCALHRWDDRRWEGLGARICAARTANTSDPATTDRLTDEELASWVKIGGVDDDQLAGTYLKLVVDEVRERRAAEAAFAEVDRQFQALECARCDENDTYCREHKPLAAEWRRARDELCEQSRVHRQILLDGTKALLGKVPP